MSMFLHWDRDNIEHEGVIEFWEQAYNHTEQFLKSAHTRDSGLHYWGEMNVHEGHYLAVDLSKPVVVLWHSINESYSELAFRALMEHFKVRFEKIDGLEWSMEYVNGNGGVQWMVINLTDSTQQALEAVYEEFDFLPTEKDESAYYFAIETSEYEDMRQEEEEYAVREWISDVLRDTPFDGFERDRMPSYVEDQYGNDNGYTEYYEHENFVYISKDFSVQKYLIPLIIEELNEERLSVDLEAMDEFFMENEEWRPYRLRQCAHTGKWGEVSKMTLFDDDQWYISPSLDTKSQRLPGFD